MTNPNTQSTMKTSRHDDLQYFRDELAAEIAYEARALFEPQPVTAAPAQPSLMLHIGRLRPVPVASAEQASRIWQLYRDGLCLGASESPKVLLKHQGQTVGYVSYNGRIWAGKPTGLPKGDPIAEAAKVEGVQVGDWLPVEDMQDGRIHLGEVVLTYPDKQALTLQLADGTRLYLQAGKLHDRYFTTFNTVAQ